MLKTPYCWCYWRCMGNQLRKASGCCVSLCNHALLRQSAPSIWMISLWNVKLALTAELGHFEWTLVQECILVKKRVQFNLHFQNNILVIQGAAILVLFSSQSEHCTCFPTHPTIVAWCENSNSFDLFSKRGLHALIWLSTVGCLRCGHRRAYEKKQHSCEIRVLRNLKETTSHVQNKKKTIWPCSCQEWGMQWGNKTKWHNEFSIFNMSS